MCWGIHIILLIVLFEDFLMCCVCCWNFPSSFSREVGPCIFPFPEQYQFVSQEKQQSCFSPTMNVRSSRSKQVFVPYIRDHMIFSIYGVIYYISGFQIHIDIFSSGQHCSVMHIQVFQVVNWLCCSCKSSNFPTFRISLLMGVKYCVVQTNPVFLPHNLMHINNGTFVDTSRLLNCNKITDSFSNLPLGDLAYQ